MAVGRGKSHRVRYIPSGTHVQPQVLFSVPRHHLVQVGYLPLNFELLESARSRLQPELGLWPAITSITSNHSLP
jgi:hypothetical protein